MARWRLGTPAPPCRQIRNSVSNNMRQRRRLDRDATASITLAISTLTANLPARTLAAKSAVVPLAAGKRVRRGLSEAFLRMGPADALALVSVLMPSNCATGGLTGKSTLLHSKLRLCPKPCPSAQSVVKTTAASAAPPLNRRSHWREAAPRESLPLGDSY